ncbi:MAG: GNAT family N-acetyltransferase [Deltaproteobacteria bacterium]|nr:GNAT family N-acetyltransferase [Deltaproteobacteria bacterium]MBK8716442.1 GNAT family N-acetyltransferase [Deltaproteobacteria bacterium]MBP7292039.1 GNAT family N-acetyltransferase [Nannocystaceae bacterium]
MVDAVDVAPTLELEAAVLRPLRASDAAALFDYLRDPAVTERTSYPEPSLSLAEAIIARAHARWAAGEPSKWGLVVRDGDVLVGTCGFNEYSAAHRWAEVAFDLAQPQWGRGLMGAAATAVLGWAFAHDRIDRAQAYVRDDNLRSQRLLERLGFEREGCLRSFRVCRGQRRDFYVYGLLSSAWHRG